MENLHLCRIPDRLAVQTAEGEKNRFGVFNTIIEARIEGDEVAGLNHEPVLRNLEIFSHDGDGAEGFSPVIDGGDDRFALALEDRTGHVPVAGEEVETGQAHLSRQLIERGENLVRVFDEHVKGVHSGSPTAFRAGIDGFGGQGGICAVPLFLGLPVEVSRHAVMVERTRQGDMTQHEGSRFLVIITILAVGGDGVVIDHFENRDQGSPHLFALVGMIIIS